MGMFRHSSPLKLTLACRSWITEQEEGWNRENRCYCRPLGRLYARNGQIQRSLFYLTEISNADAEQNPIPFRYNL